MPLTPDERREFLAGPHVATLAVAMEGRGPLQTPIWYACRSDGDLMVTTGTTTRKAQAVRTAGRYSLLVQRTSPGYRYVSVEGPLVSADATTPEELAQVAGRYLPAKAVQGYVEGALDKFGPGGLLTLRMHPEHWLGADLGAS